MSWRVEGFNGINPTYQCLFLQRYSWLGLNKDGTFKDCANKKDVYSVFRSINEHCAGQKLSLSLEETLTGKTINKT